MHDSDAIDHVKFGGCFWNAVETTDEASTPGA